MPGQTDRPRDQQANRPCDSIRPYPYQYRVRTKRSCQSKMNIPGEKRPNETRSSSLIPYVSLSCLSVKFLFPSSAVTPASSAHRYLRALSERSHLRTLCTYLHMVSSTFTMKSGARLRWSYQHHHHHNQHHYEKQQNPSAAASSALSSKLFSCTLFLFHTLVFLLSRFHSASGGWYRGAGASSSPTCRLPSSAGAVPRVALAARVARQSSDGDSWSSKDGSTTPTDPKRLPDPQIVPGA